MTFVQSPETKVSTQFVFPYLFLDVDIPTYHRVTLDAVYTSDLEYFDFDSDMEPMVISRAMAREPWNAAYFQKLRYYILYSESQIYEYIA